MRGRKREAASRTSQPASREGEHGRGAKAGHRKRQKGPRLEVSVQPDGKSWRLRNRQSQAQRQRLGEEVGKGTGANEGIRHLEQSSGHRRLTQGWGYKGMERAMALGALLRGSSIHLNTPNIQNGTYILATRRCTHSHLPGLFLLCETKVFLASCSLPQSRSTPPNPSPRSPRPRCQATPNLFPHSSCPTGPWELLQLRGSEGRTGEGAARVSYLEGGEVGVAHDPMDGLEVGQVPLRHVHQLGGVYLVGEVGRAVLQRGRVFILVAVFLGWGPRQSLD